VQSSEAVLPNNIIVGTWTLLRWLCFYYIFVYALTIQYLCCAAWSTNHMRADTEVVFMVRRANSPAGRRGYLFTHSNHKIIETRTR